MQKPKKSSKPKKKLAVMPSKHGRIVCGVCRAEIRPRAQPRPLATARYEGGADADELCMQTVAEIQRLITEGRVPLDVADRALAIAHDEVNDALAEGSVSWVDDPAKAQVSFSARGDG